ncbi:MAG: YitT family protein [Erysipelotrichaceae bacterium]|nr:YitT family protein [Erysipelotrichaceae bacterium]
MKIDYRKAFIMGFWVILSALFQSIALVNFSVPGHLYPAGVSGISRLLSDLMLDYLSLNIPYQLLYFVFNVILALIVYKYIGKYFTVFSVLQTTLVSVISGIMPKMIVLDDILLLAVFGGVINGFGCGLALSHDASSGGMDFVSIYLSNRYNRSMWNVIFGVNCMIVLTAGLVYGWQLAMYSMIFQFCNTQIISRMHKRFTHEALNIITKKPDEVSEEIFRNTRHGITQIKAVGAFKHEDATMLYMVINSYQCNDVVSAAKKADPNAFICVSSVNEVIGNYYQKPLE